MDTSRWTNKGLPTTLNERVLWLLDDGGMYLLEGFRISVNRSCVLSVIKYRFMLYIVSVFIIEEWILVSG